MVNENFKSFIAGNRGAPASQFWTLFNTGFFVSARDRSKLTVHFIVYVQKLLFMKYTATLLISCFIFSSAISQQWKFTSYYSLNLPQGQMGKNIQAAHSIQVAVLYSLPKGLKNLSVGAELGIGKYAHKKIDQTFEFEGVSTVVPVDYNSNLFNTNIQARFNFWDESKTLIVPYIVAKGGLYSLYSNVVIEDPENPDGCTALDRDNIINDQAMYWSAGGGFQISPDLFRKTKRHGRLKIDISAHTIRGGSIDYINTKHLMDAQDVPEPGAKSLTARFINASTQHIHEHSVAQVYTSPLRFFELRAGVSIIF